MSEAWRLLLERVLSFSSAAGIALDHGTHPKSEWHDDENIVQRTPRPASSHALAGSLLPSSLSMCQVTH